MRARLALALALITGCVGPNTAWRQEYSACMPFWRAATRAEDNACRARADARIATSDAGADAR